LTLLDDIATGLMEPRINFLKLIGVLDLNAEVIEAGLPAPCRDGEIDPGIIEHPLGVVGLDHGGLGYEQRRIEPDRLREIFDRHMDVKALHDRSPFRS